MLTGNGDHPPLNTIRWFWLAALAALAADLLSKELVFANLGPPTGGDDPGYWLLPGAFRLVCHFNTGGAFGWASGNILLFLGAAAVLVPVLVLTAYHCRDPRAPLWGLGLVVGGAIGNLYDRLLHPGVRDFLELVNPRTGFSLWPVFNLADVAIVVGVAAYLVWSFFDNRRGKRQAVNPDNRTDP